MRKWNNRLARILLVLLGIHALMGSLMLLGFSTVSFRMLSWILLAAVILHGILGILSTFSAVKNGRKSGKWYLKQNAIFWTKRLSGLVILLLLAFHVTAYTTSEKGKVFLREFTFERMSVQLLFILAIFVHLVVSVKSMLIAKGTIKWKERTVDWMLVLTVMLLFFVVAVIVYYIQWQM